MFLVLHTLINFVLVVAGAFASTFVLVCQMKMNLLIKLWKKRERMIPLKILRRPCKKQRKGKSKVWDDFQKKSLLVESFVMLNVNTI